jgi:putative oxidoreductase
MNMEKTEARRWAPLPLRLVLGFGLMAHGVPKVFTGEGYRSFVGMLSEIGLPMPEIVAYLVGGFEVVGGFFLVVGAVVRAVALIGIVEMIVAATAVHWPSGFNFINITGMTPEGAPQFGLPGYEVNLLYIAGLATLALAGPGTLALWDLSRTSVSDLVTKEARVGRVRTGRWPAPPPRDREISVTIDQH